MPGGVQYLPYIRLSKHEGSMTRSDTFEKFLYDRIGTPLPIWRNGLQYHLVSNRDEYFRAVQNFSESTGIGGLLQEFLTNSANIELLATLIAHKCIDSVDIDLVRRGFLPATSVREERRE